jgi:hypothetical protein
MNNTEAIVMPVHCRECKSIAASLPRSRRDHSAIAGFPALSMQRRAPLPQR